MTRVDCDFSSRDRFGHDVGEIRVGLDSLYKERVRVCEVKVRLRLVQKMKTNTVPESGFREDLRRATAAQ